MTLPIPQAALAQHMIVLGKTGAGKSSVMRVIVEHLLERDEPVCIIDPKGDWYGLRSAADGKKPGCAVVIFGGEHADIPINPHAGAAVAELVATGNRPSLIDLGGWMVGERTRFFIEFASTLFKHTRGARHLVIDEIHNFAPQGKVMDVDAGKMLHWSNRLASEGRGKGLTILAASQRPQKVHKDFLTGCETLIAMRVIHKLDRDAIKDWIDGCADPAKGKEVLATLAGMKRGSAWVWSPEIEFGPELIKFPMFWTYDSFKPQAADAGKLKGWAEVNLDEVRSKMSAAIAENQANDPALLKKRIAELERQARTPGPPAHTAGDLLAAEQRGADRVREEFRIKATTDTAMARDALMECAKTLSSLATKLEREAPQWPLPQLPVRDGVSLNSAAHPRGKGPMPRSRLSRGSTEKIEIDRDPEIGKGGKHRIMVALAQHQGGLTPRRLALLVGMSDKSGTWSTYLGVLRTAGYIEGSAVLRITDAGLTALGPYEDLPTGRELREYWSARLGNGGLRAIFDTLVEHYPGRMPQDQIAQMTGLSATSGTFSTYLGRLRGMGLIEGGRDLSAAEELWN